MRSRRRQDGKAPRTLRLGVGTMLIAAIVVRELRKPEDQRTWHGVLAGVVPYDLRRPTLGRFRERMWNPTSGHLFAPTVFGIGWTLNVGRVVALLRGRLRPG